MNNYFVYLHKLEDGTVFYVGCARCYISELGYGQQHKRAYASNPRPDGWSEYNKKGKIVEIVDYFYSKAEAYRKEEQLSAELRTQGHPLTNRCAGPGTKGNKEKLSTRQKKSETKIGILNPMYGRVGELHHNSKKVLDTATGKIYPSITAAAEHLGLRMQRLHNMLTGFRVNTTTMELL